MEMREKYIKELEQKLVEYDVKIDKMKVQLAEAKADMKMEYRYQVTNLERKRDEFVVKYGQLKDSSGHAWDDLKLGTEKAWDELEDSFEKAGTRFK